MSDHDEFQSSSDNFIRWFLDHPGARISSKVGLTDLRFRGAGRGLVAVADIEEDEELFVIPRGCVLSVENSDLKSRIPQEMAQLDPWLSLILVMIYEHLRGSQSRWKQYLDVLPETFNTLMFWSEAELAELQGSAVRHKVGKTDADQTFRDQLVPIIQAHPDIFPSAPTASSVGSQERLFEPACLDLAHRMGSIILAYSFDIESEDNDIESDEDDCFVIDDGEEDGMLKKGMVPLADMLNADADRNNACVFPGKLTLSMKSTKPITKGAEIFNDYGPLPRSDLLRRYGYLTDNYAQYDVIELPTTSIVEEAFRYTGLNDERELRLGLLREHDCLDSDYDISLPNGSDSAFPDELLVVIQVLVHPGGPLFIEHMRKGLPKPAKPPGVIAVLREVLLKRRLTYETSVEQDEQLLQRDLAERRRLAIQVRLGEKRVLERALLELDDTLNTSSGLGFSNGSSGTTQKRGGEDDLNNGVKKSRSS